MGKSWLRVSAIAVAVVALGVLVWALVAIPSLAAPVEAAAVVLGTGFTAFAAYSAWQAARVSRAGTIDALRREREALIAERTRLEGQQTSLEAWRMVAVGKADYAGAGKLTSDLAAAGSRIDQIAARLESIRAEIGD